MRATACSISTRRSAVASGPPASVSGPAPAPHDVDAADPLDLVGGGDQEPAPHAARRAPFPWPTWRPSTTRSAPASRASRRASRLVDGGQRHDQLGARLPQPRDLFFAGRDRILAPCRRASLASVRVGDAEHADPDAADGLQQRGRHARATRAQVDRQPRRDDVAPRRRARRSRRARPRTARACTSSVARKRARMRVGRLLTSCVLLSGNDSPPPSSTSTAPPLLARPRAPASRSARCRPADRWCSRTARASRGSRPCRRSSAAARRHRRGRPRHSATGTIAAISGDGREESRERGAHGQHYGNPTSPLAIPGLLPAACLTAGVPPFKFASPLSRRQ